MDKKILRKSMKSQRAALSNDEVKNLSGIIADKVINSEEFKKCSAVYIYLDFSNEVMTEVIIEEAFSQNKKVAVPRINGHDMEFYYINGFDEVKPGYYGILEPLDATVPAKDESVLMIMPGLAFTKEFIRVGYGCGFYDSYLNSHKDMKFFKLALAYDFQVIDEEIEADRYDVKPNIIITEKRELIRS